MTTIAKYGADLPSAHCRIADMTAARLRDPDGHHRDLSPLYHGVDSLRLARRVLMEAGGDRRTALELLIQDIRSRYPGFTASPDSTGYAEYDRVRHRIYDMTKG